MTHARRLRTAWLTAALFLFAVPAAAHAYTVNVHVHGAGKVVEITPRLLMNCTTNSDRANGSITECWAGSTSGLYSWGDIIELQASVPASYATHGWRFDRWADGSAAGQINCDSWSGAGAPPPTNCKFQIFENLHVDLYFVDVLAPDTSLGSGGPSGTTGSSAASFTFNSPDPDARYECRLDGGSWSTCGDAFDKSESYNSLAHGSHTFSVRAKDAQGNTDTTPVSRTWFVDRVGPTVSIDDGPRPRTNEGTATFTWSANESVKRYECSKDLGAFQICSSGAVQTGFGAEGTHTFDVRAVDLYDNVGPTVRGQWVVDKTPPQTTITGGPEEDSTSSSLSATFSFDAEPGATYTCSFDGAAPAPCTSPESKAGLAGGTHTFEVAATDTAGNADPTPAERTWRIVPPDADSDGVDAATDCDDSDPDIRPGATDVYDDGIDQDCDGEDAEDPDRDGDGAPRPLDCNDGNAGIRPGAADVAGNGVDEDCNGADATIAVVADADGDGVIGSLDCNDGDAGIRPGAPDAPADGVDQDCSGADATFAVVGASITYQWFNRGAKTWARKLSLTKVSSGAVVTVRCKGRGCKFKRKRMEPSSNGVVDVRKVLKKRKLRTRAVLEIRVEAPGMTVKVVRFKMRKGKVPSGGKFQCIPPGASKRQAC